MAELTLDTSQFHETMAQLKKITGEERLQVFEVMARAAGVELDGIARATLPPEPSGKSQSQFWTKKQRRWWWATMHAKAEGRTRLLPGWKATYKRISGVKRLVISGSYRRTGLGVRSLTYDTVRRGGNEVLLRYGTNTKYMRYVIDEEEQAKYHEGTWKTLQEIIRRNIDILSEVAAEAGAREIDRRLGGG